jgi:hypothetical protein
MLEHRYANLTKADQFGENGPQLGTRFLLLYENKDELDRIYYWGYPVEDGKAKMVDGYYVLYEDMLEFE